MSSILVRFRFWLSVNTQWSKNRMVVTFKFFCLLGNNILHWRKPKVFLNRNYCCWNGVGTFSVQLLTHPGFKITLSVLSLTCLSFCLLSNDAYWQKNKSSKKIVRLLQYLSARISQIIGRTYYFRTFFCDDFNVIACRLVFAPFHNHDGEKWRLWPQKNNHCLPVCLSLSLSLSKLLLVGKKRIESLFCKFQSP